MGRIHTMTTRRGLTILSGIVLASGAVMGLGFGELRPSVRSGIVAHAMTEGVEHELATRQYEIDPTHTNVIFKIRHGSVSNFYGRFNDIKGEIQLDEDDFTKSSITTTVQMKSIDTNNRTRDGHLKGADFFNVRQFSEAKFESTSITKKSGDTYELKGEFTLQGQTKEIVAELRDVRTGQFNNFDVLGVEARFSIKRSDFGITKYLDTSKPEEGPLGDLVEIIVGIEAIGK